MQDIPQPSSDPYSVGDRVEIYLASDDDDARFHGTLCEVIKVQTDDLGAETGRTTDAYSYSLRGVEADDPLPIQFRHHDLVPADTER